MATFQTFLAFDLTLVVLKVFIWIFRTFNLYLMTTWKSLFDFYAASLSFIISISWQTAVNVFSVPTLKEF